MIPILRWLALAFFNVWVSMRFQNETLVFIPVILAIHSIIFAIYLASLYSCRRSQAIRFARVRNGR